MMTFSIVTTPFARCWSCDEQISDGVTVGAGGGCAHCIKRAGITNEQAAASLPYVWGQRATRIERAAQIVKGLTATNGATS